MKAYLKLLTLIFLSIPFGISAQSFQQVDQNNEAILYKWDNTFVSYKYTIKSDSAYRVFFDKNFFSLEEFKKIFISKTLTSIPVEQQKLSNATLPKVSVEFMEVTKTGANKYKIVFKYIETIKLNAPHFYCFDVESDKDPEVSKEFFQVAKKLGGLYCGDEY
ncbi:MAG: hypothetical protein V4677_09830 [Bacteroidota bacterium]